MKLVKLLIQLEQQILAAILLVLHSLTWIYQDKFIHFSMVFVLYGLFFMWQPLWGKDKKVNTLPSFIIIILLLSFSYSYPNEALMLFSLIVSGLIGSRLFSHNTSRAFDLLAISILIMEMAIGIIPNTFPQINLAPQFTSLIQTLLLIPILAFFFAPSPDRTQQPRSQIDFMHGLLTSTLIFLALLGGIVINILYGVDYLDGLLLTVFIVATLSIGISWFWNPGIGYSGLGVLWNRYAMTIGGPFEIWINTLTTLIEEPYISASEFLQAACEHLIENDWLNGIQWQFEGFAIISGSKHGAIFHHKLSEQILVTIYFKSDPGKALRQHTILLIRMAYQFYLAKLNQDKMRAQEHFETIHHTGARLTHDIKNILQSIKTSIDIVQATPEEKNQKSNKLLKQNLDQISNRLESTLEKLKSPEISTSIKITSIEEWIKQFQNEHSYPWLKINQDINLNHAIPSELFDSVVSNLISNTQNKKEVTEVILDITANDEMIVITVCDNGDQVKTELENNLFIKPVSSGEGMGIGLYQSAIMARSFNFELELANNEAGKVCFSLYQHLGE
jgi:signal transduction histidine kinase